MILSPYTESIGARPLSCRWRSMLAQGGSRSRPPRWSYRKEKAQPDHPPGAQSGMVRKHKPHRPDDVRSAAQQYFSLAKGMAHEPEVALLQIAKPAVDQLGAGGRGMRAEIVLFA